MRRPKAGKDLVLPERLVMPLPVVIGGPNFIQNALHDAELGLLLLRLVLVTSLFGFLDELLLVNYLGIRKSSHDRESNNAR